MNAPEKDLAPIDEQLRIRFETAWRENHPLRIEDCLPPETDPRYLSTLEKLVHIDLEFAWQASSTTENDETTSTPSKIEHYLARFPVLNQEDVVRRLVQQEFQVRVRWGDHPIAEEYRRRFPEQIRQEADLGPLPSEPAADSNENGQKSALHNSPSEPASLAGSGQIRIRCPHCSNPIELVPDAPFSEIECPSCGSSFSLVNQSDTATHKVQRRQIAHFQLLDQLGMGNFGSVWRAHDATLDRTVAVKIPRREQFDEESFFREARATAQLRHPNIVSVHEIGRDGDTVYIASDFIDGADLRAWLKDRPMSLHETARLCATLAEALHHAHEAGVIHRDFKPSNVMMDSQGNPHVMDFGLAKRESGEITMTLRGQIMGTPAYMSPEQARGEGHSADRRTDVYSLGVVLFEMLTGELPFRGERRMLVVQILSDDPISPRRLNSRIHRDLETICLKCLEKKPERRYDTAADLAADLRAWLDKRTIKARPIGRMARTVRWCQRRPAVASLLGLVVLVTTIGFALVTWQWRLANARLAEATQQRARADEYLGTLLEGMDKMLLEVGAERLEDEPHMEQTRRTLIELALAYYRDLARGDSESSQTQPYLIRALAQAGKMSGWLGDDEMAVDTLNRSNVLLDQLSSSGRTMDDAESLRAHNCFNLGKAFASLDRKDEAIKSFQEAADTRRRQIEKGTASRDDKLMLAFTLNEWGNMLREMSRVEHAKQAEEFFRESIGLLESLLADSSNKDRSDLRRAMATAHHNLAVLLGKSRYVDAEQSYLKAAELLETIEDEQPGDKQMRGAVLGDASLFWQDHGQAERAFSAVKQALALFQGLARDYPATPQYRHHLALAYQHVAWAHWGRKELDQAHENYQLSAEILGELVDDRPTFTDYRKRLATTRNLMGIVLKQMGELDAAIEGFEWAAEIWRRALETDPGDVEAHHELGGVLSNIAGAYSQQDKLTEAAELLERAIHHQLIACQEDPQNTEYLDYLTNHYITQGRVCKMLDRRPASLEAYAQASEIAGQKFQIVPNEKHKRDIAMIGFERAVYLLNHSEARQEDFQLARKLAEKAHSLIGDSSEGLEFTLGAAMLRTGDAAESIDILTRVADDDEVDRAYRCWSSVYAALALIETGKREAAGPYLDRARQLSTDPEHPDPDDQQRLIDQAAELLLEDEESEQETAEK